MGAWLSQTGSWSQDKGTRGKGPYGLADEWSQWYGGHNESYSEETLLFMMGQDACCPGCMTYPKNTSKVQHQHKQCQLQVIGGRYAALGGDQDHDGLDIPLHLLVLQEAGDVPEKGNQHRGYVGKPIENPANLTQERDGKGWRQISQTPCFDEGRHRFVGAVGICLENLNGRNLYQTGRTHAIKYSADL